MSEKYIEFEGNKCIARLNELDITKKVIGGTNVIYNLRILRVDKDNVRCCVWNGVNVITATESCKIEDIARRLTNPKTNLIMDLAEVFGGDLPNDVMLRIRGACMQVQQKWLDSKYAQGEGFPDLPGFPLPEDRAKKIIIISDEDRELAKELLRNKDILNKIDNEIGKTVVGEVGTRLHLFVSYLQAYTKRYPQGTGQGESSSGKSWMFTNVLNFIPHENWRKTGRISKTALERMNLDEDIKIIYVMEGRGKDAATDSIRLSSSDDGGMDAWITNKETGEVDCLHMRGLSIFTTTTSTEIHHEDSTRNNLYGLDESIDQNGRVVKYENKEARYPDAYNEAFELVETDQIKNIWNAIRLLKKDIEVVVPYMPVMDDVLDITKCRIKRDNKRLIGFIMTLALLRQYQRRILEIDGNTILLISDIEDFRDALRLSDTILAKTYYNMDEHLTELYDIIKKLYTESVLSKKSEGIEDVGIHTNTISASLMLSKKILYRSAHWLSDHLNELVKNGILIEEWRMAEGNHPQGKYYRPIGSTDYKSIFKSTPADNILQDSIDSWIKETEENGIKKNKSVRWIEACDTEKYLDDLMEQEKINKNMAVSSGNGKSGKSGKAPINPEDQGLSRLSNSAESLINSEGK
jgi:hypothetical protein